MIQDMYNVKRVHKISIFMIIFIVALLSVQALLTEGVSLFLRIAISAVVVIIISLINYVMPYSSKIIR